MPDLNSIPPSPSRSRRPTGTSISAASPTSINILPSNQQAVNATSNSSLPSPALPAAHGQDGTGTAATAAAAGGPGPLRHPRPLTAAELHSELEQEQELLVNRLTRDLTMLRAAHNSSVVSNASSASASASASADHPSSFTDTHMLSGPGFHIPATSADRRHHRTSSSTSARSFNQSMPAPIPIAHHSGSAASVLEAARNPRGASSMSRQNSTTSHRSRSRNHSPGPYHHHGSNPSSSYPYSQQHHAGDPSGYFRVPTGATSNTSVAATPGGSVSDVLSPGMLPATHRYEETAFYRTELESAKRENDNLKRRVKELERMLREQHRRESSVTRQPQHQHQQQSQQAGDHGSATGAPRERTDSVSTTTSAVSVSGTTGVGGGGTGIAPGRRVIERMQSSISFAGSMAVGVPEEEVKVGESAASSAGVRKESTASAAAVGAAEPTDIQ
ncbi:hypothetical protein Micbo1qcDRAFT_166649 [Microdochium bolleyi]|uniref:Uncharacterized protein n=1 Tax=Microdochium bolleyi TaxID=196109 RepID=A0A136IU57_9PEZI|nr:hypothetical protein Micbo1qcDRAFT_166649 [Microdochium bolleyi]